MNGELTEQVCVKFSKIKHQQIEKEAGKKGLAVAAWIRMIVLEKLG